MDDSCLGEGKQPPVLYPSETMLSVADRSVGVQCKIAVRKTAGTQTDEDDDAGARPVLTSPRRSSTEMPDEHAAQGTIAPTTVAAGAERRELDETRTVLHAGASPRRPSTDMPDEHAAQGTIAPTTVAAGAERRELDETGTVPHAGASPRRPSTEMLDEHAAQGSLTLTTVATGAERRELDETGKVPQAGVASTSPRSPSTECRDEQAAQGTCLASKTEADTCKLQAYLQQRGVFAATFLKPAVPSAGSIARIGASVAERRVFEEARADPPEDCSSGSEEETRASPTVSTAGAQTDESDYAGDSSVESMSSVTDGSVGGQCDTAELKTTGIFENDDEGDSSEITRVRRTAGAQTEENDDDMMAPPSLSTETFGDQAAGGALTPTTDPTGAGRRVFDELLESECLAVELETGDEAEERAIFHQAASAAEAEQGRERDEDAPPEVTYGLPETTHIDVAASDEGAETSDGDSECDEPYSPDLDTIFDAIGELADGREWVPMRQLQARTSLSLERLKELLEEWVFMGVIVLDDTKSKVALCLSAAEALMHDCRVQIENDLLDDED